MRKIGLFVGLDYEIGPFVGIGPVVGIGLFGGTDPVVSLTYLSMVCLHYNLSLSRAEVGIIGEPAVRIRDRVWPA